QAPVKKINKNEYQHLFSALGSSLLLPVFAVPTFFFVDINHIQIYTQVPSMAPLESLSLSNTNIFNSNHTSNFIEWLDCIENSLTEYEDVCGNARMRIEMSQQTRSSLSSDYPISSRHLPSSESVVHEQKLCAIRALLVNIKMQMPADDDDGDDNDNNSLDKQCENLLERVDKLKERISKLYKAPVSDLNKKLPCVLEPLQIKDNVAELSKSTMQLCTSPALVSKQLELPPASPFGHPGMRLPSPAFANFEHEEIITTLREHVPAVKPVF
ncbi:hypothetical protein GQ42DRAFT_48621, partial [Ramicandelaber brevisporus]